jgi:hypothetical protein
VYDPAAAEIKKPATTLVLQVHGQVAAAAICQPKHTPIAQISIMTGRKGQQRRYRTVTTIKPLGSSPPLKAAAGRTAETQYLSISFVPSAPAMLNIPYLLHRPSLSHFFVRLCVFFLSQKATSRQLFFSPYHQLPSSLIPSTLSSSPTYPFFFDHLTVFPFSIFTRLQGANPNPNHGPPAT